MVPTNSGLKPLTHDRSKDYSHVSKFGAVKASSIPATLNRKRLPILDQGETNFCTAFATSRANSYRLLKSFSPEFTTAMEGLWAGSPIIDGTDPKTAMDAGRLSGFLPQELSPFQIGKDENEKIDDWHNYSEELRKTAYPFAPGAWYAVGLGSGDVFDNIRAALVKGKSDNAVVQAYGRWYDEWNRVGSSGRVMVGKNQVSLHAYLFVDFFTEAGTDYLVGHLSQGTAFGDKGFLYFSRNVVNEAWKDMNGVGLYIYRTQKDAFQLVQIIKDWIRIITSRLPHG